MENPLSRLNQQLQSLAPGQQYWIGLVGAPGSGKSTLASWLQQQLGDDLLVLPMDGYHYYRQQLDQMPDSDWAYSRRGAPFTFDAERCVQELLAARQSGQGLFPGFDHAEGDPVEGMYPLLPNRKLVLVEGNYLLLQELPWARLKDEVFDETWLLDIDLAVSNQRVFQRHCSLGMSAEIARQRVDSNDGLNAALILQQSRPRADIRWSQAVVDALLA
ncbi:uridine kinase [Parathalassolituus penaei]|uniref:Uridine kinase n=1 Tax=Parathalassolituus penaei TaxID=2997323 RepID=A0A9X3EBD0_9GAMM|nr:uridine kinase [Parathalassolituus penaei]MCY0964076.1 uridine kinase [Parathalassolituus penaei]